MSARHRPPVGPGGHGDWLLAGLDACLVCTAWVTALLLRFDARPPAAAWTSLFQFLPVAVVVVLLCNAVAGLYSGIWRHASVFEARRVIVAQAASLMVVVASDLLLGHPVPLSLPFVAALLGTALVGAVRFQSRLFALRRNSAREQRSVIVIGAGSAGAALVKDVRLRNRPVRVLAFLDDDPRLLGRRIHGIQVVGKVENLPAAARRMNVSHAVLAVPSASPALVRRVAALADDTGIVLRVVPPPSELVDGQVLMTDVRDIEVADLLGRVQVERVLDDVRAMLRGKRVLITGAGGSIGSEIARQVTPIADRVILVDHDETHLFDCAAGLVGNAVQRLADIREPLAVHQIFSEERPHIVFHAAAHKHVPLLEDHPVEAVLTNVLGTRTMVEEARRAGVERFVFISTDKAVHPSSVMGATKLIGEHIVLDDPAELPACAVRFGNVLGSRGSVVPTFTAQIRAGGPVTITDPRMTRYFMSIPEAVRLVLHAAALSSGGEVFMLDMGEPVRILDLAKRMIRLSGRRPGADVEIRVTGLRPGEKLSERLHFEDEVPVPTSHPAVLRLTPRPLPGMHLKQLVWALERCASHRDNERMRELILAALQPLSGSRPHVPAPRSTASAAAPDSVVGGHPTWT